MNKLIKAIAHPSDILVYLNRKNLLPISDKMYLKFLYRKTFHKKLDLNNPQDFQEKLQWLKLNDRNPNYIMYVDKYKVRDYIKEKIGEEYLIPLLGVYDSFDEINFDELPNQFVIKCNHDSASVIVCKDKKTFDVNAARKKITSCLKHNYYLGYREWVYKYVERKIIIEKYMEDTKQKELIDYKVYAFRGQCDYVMACFDRFNNGPKFIYYDRNWQVKKEFSLDGIKYGGEVKLTKPKNLDKMFELSSFLSQDIPFVRVDWYEVNGHLYFGELTLFPTGGFDTTRTKDAEEYLKKMLEVK